MAIVNGKKVLAVVKTLPAGYYPIEYFSFYINDEGNLVLKYHEDTEAAFHINEKGHLIYNGKDNLNLKLNRKDGHVYWHLL